MQTEACKMGDGHIVGELQEIQGMLENPEAIKRIEQVIILFETCIKEAES